jgi:hypothetical protein
MKLRGQHVADDWGGKYFMVQSFDFFFLLFYDVVSGFRVYNTI